MEYPAELPDYPAALQKISSLLVPLLLLKDDALAVFAALGAVKIYRDVAFAFD